MRQLLVSITLTVTLAGCWCQPGAPPTPREQAVIAQFVEWWPGPPLNPRKAPPIRHATGTCADGAYACYEWGLTCHTVVYDGQSCALLWHELTHWALVQTRGSGDGEHARPEWRVRRPPCRWQP